MFWLSLGIVFFVFLYLIRSILLPFVVGVMTAYFLDPAADKLEAKGLSRGLATLLITACFFFVLILLCLWITPIVIDQFSGLISTLPEYANAISQQYGDQISRFIGKLPAAPAADIQQAITNISGVLLKLVGDFLSGVFQSGIVIVNLLSLLLITPVVTFYLLLDWDRMLARLNRLLPKAHAHTIRQQLSVINHTLAGFLRGQINVCLILAAYYSIGLGLTGLKFSIVIGAITGFLVILPYVGVLFGLLVALGVALFQFDNYAQIGAVAAVFLIGQVLEGYFLTPKLVGSKVGLHPVWIIFGMLAGAALFGFVGILLAVPVTAVIGVLIRFALDQYLDSGYYTSDRAKK